VDALGGVDARRSHAVHEGRVHGSKVLPEDVETAVDSLWVAGDRRVVRLAGDVVGGDEDESGGDRYIRRSGDASLIGSGDAGCGSGRGPRWGGDGSGGSRCARGYVLIPLAGRG
jgi:hypothetical protein